MSEHINVLNRVFLYCFMRNFEQLCVQYLSVNQIINNRGKNHAFPVRIR